MVTRRLFLQGLGAMGLAVTLPVPVLRSRALPEPLGPRMVVPLIGSGRLTPAALADAFCAVEMWDFRVIKVFMADLRFEELVRFAEARHRGTVWGDPRTAWGVECLAVDCSDHELVLEADPERWELPGLGRPVELGDLA